MNDPIQVLKAGLRTVRHHTIRWLKDDLMIDGKLDGTKEKLYAKMFADYNAQKIYIRAQQDIMGEDFNPLKVMPGRDEHGQFSFSKNVDVPKKSPQPSLPSSCLWCKCIYLPTFTSP